LAFDAQTEDVRNGLDLSQEAMNQMWDRVDSLLDHTVSNYNSDADRDANILMAGIRAQADAEAGGGMSETMTALIGLAGTALTASIYKDGITSTYGTVMDGINSALGAIGIGDGDGIDILGAMGIGSTASAVAGATGATGTAAATTGAAAGAAGSGGVLSNLGAFAVANPFTATIAAVAALEALDANPFGKDEALEVDLVDSVENVLEGDIDLNTFDDGALEVDLVDTFDRDWLDWSDTRLKENIQHYSTIGNVNYYTWDWNDKGKALGADQYPSFGVLAQEVQKTHPHAVTEGEDGYLRVNYGMINNEV
jgi:hypothetical protein